MKTYQVTNAQGQPTYAFEIENIYIGLNAITRILAEVEGVNDVRARKAFAKSCNAHIEFKYLEVPYIVWEPYGDSSRYWIGPNGSVSSTPQASALENAFKRYQPPLFRTILGDVLTLQFVNRMFSGKKNSG